MKIMANTEIYYYGCAIGSKGHYMFAPGMSSVDLKKVSEILKQLSKHPDCGYLPGPVGKYYAPRGGYEVVHDGDWTILSFHDWSEDDRPNSHSTFLIKVKDMDHDVTLEYSERYFPEVFKRARDKGYKIEEIKRGEE